MGVASIVDRTGTGVLSYERETVVVEFKATEGSGDRYAGEVELQTESHTR